ncbi:hypothetical protein MNBD_ALPHA07-1965 [hydrothermal vent metagenome]|uniref:Uncharacterized protein n=1 Tax=hydrothermal vent metagenome TaxID=652676 RepID=A0A3B0RJ17_9ZZZZ
MADLTLAKTRIFEGVWEGVLTYDGKGKFQPEIEVTHLDQALEDVEITAGPGEGQWGIRVPIPVASIADGVQTFLIRDARNGDVLNSFALMSGDFLSYDIRVEMALLREELDMMKRVLRHHLWGAK